MVMDEWLYIVLLNGSANVASKIPLEYIEQQDRSLPLPQNFKVLCLRCNYNEIKKNWDHSIHQHVQKFECTKLELFCFIFEEVIKKSL